MSKLPRERVLNKTLTDSLGRDVVLIDVFAAEPGQRLILTFEEAKSPWRQGVWVGTHGRLAANGVEASQFAVWRDTSPRVAAIDIAETDGFIRLYNIWDSGRAIAPHESQSDTSGMLVARAGERSRRYRCNDIGYQPDFDRLVFSVEVQ